MALPSVVLVALMLVWVVAMVTAQLQCVDAARAGARVVARGESVAASEAAALQAAPDGARVTITVDGEFIRVEVGVDVKPVGGLLGFLPTVTVDGVAHAISEAASASGRQPSGEPATDRVGAGAGPLVPDRRLDFLGSMLRVEP